MHGGEGAPIKMIFCVFPVSLKDVIHLFSVIVTVLARKEREREREREGVREGRGG